MTVPSYDDLTPGIPDDVDSKSVSQLALFLREDLKKPASPSGSGPAAETGGSPAILYACLRGPADGGPPIETLFTIAQDFSPRVMRAGGHEILLDVSGLGRLIGDPAAIAAALSRSLAQAGAAASVAIAPTQTAARLLAAAGIGVTAGVLDPAAVLTGLPVGLLQDLETLPPAISQRDRARPYETLERWGITTLGDLIALPAAALSSRLGRRGVALRRLGLGLDPRPFVPDGDTPRYIGRLELEWPLDTLEPLSFVLARLLEPLSAALERADRGAAAIRLDLRLTDRSTHTRLLQLPAPMRDPRVLRTLLLLDLEAHPPFGSEVMVDVVAIELDPAPARITQFSLLERAVPSPETLSTLTARLAALVGETRVGAAVLLDSHRPGVFAMERFTLDRAQPPIGPRGGCVLRRQRIPPAIRVRVEHGRPVHVAAAKRAMPQGTVVQAAGPWRTSGEWWTVRKQTEGSPSEPDAGWHRDEWDVALTGGAICRIFQDRPTGRWFLDGVYD